MGKQILLRIINGNFDQGFSYCLDISEEGKPPHASYTGKLPANSNLVTDYQEWQKAYYFHDPIVRSKLRNSRIMIPSGQENHVINEAPPDYPRMTKKFRETMHDWLDSKEFQEIKEHILWSLNRDESTQLIISTNVPYLQKLPWSVWSLCSNRSIEITFSSVNFSVLPSSSSDKLSKKIQNMLQWLLSVFP